MALDKQHSQCQNQKGLQKYESATKYRSKLNNRPSKDVESKESKDEVLRFVTNHIRNRWLSPRRTWRTIVGWERTSRGTYEQLSNSFSLGSVINSVVVSSRKGIVATRTGAVRVVVVVQNICHDNASTRGTVGIILIGVLAFRFVIAKRLNGCLQIRRVHNKRANDTEMLGRCK